VTADRDDPRRPVLPRFFVEWRQDFEGGEDLEPLDYVDFNNGVPFVLTAQWLFCPRFVEYRGCVIRICDPRGVLADAQKKAIDGWFDHFDGDISQIEAKANLLSLWDVFSNSDLTPYCGDLSELARSIAQCWKGLLATRFRDRPFQVEVHDDDSSYGPEVTFFTRATESSSR